MNLIPCADDKCCCHKNGCDNKLKKSIYNNANIADDKKELFLSILSGTTEILHNRPETRETIFKFLKNPTEENYSDFSNIFLEYFCKDEDKKDKEDIVIDIEI